jgi:hypothetical protein
MIALGLQVVFVIIVVTCAVRLLVLRRWRSLGLLVLGLVAVLVPVILAIHRSMVPYRCRKVLAEAIVARDGEGADPRPSDAAWYDEHCYNGSPRR